MYEPRELEGLQDLRQVRRSEAARRLFAEFGLAHSTFVEIIADASLPARARALALAAMMFKVTPRDRIPKRMRRFVEIDDTIVMLVALCGCAILLHDEQLVAYRRRYLVMRLMPSSLVIARVVGNARAVLTKHNRWPRS